MKTSNLPEKEPQVKKPKKKKQTIKDTVAELAKKVEALVDAFNRKNQSSNTRFVESSINDPEPETTGFDEDELQWLSAKQLQERKEAALLERIYNREDKNLDFLIDTLDSCILEDAEILSRSGSQVQVFGESVTGPRLQGEYNELKALGDEETGFLRRGSAPGLGGSIGPTSYNRERVVKQAYFLYGRNDFAKNIINIYTFLTLGSGMKVTFDTPEVQKLWDDQLKQQLKWDTRVRRIVRLTYLYGEYFVLRTPMLGGEFVDPDTGRIDRPGLTARLAGVQDKVNLNELDPTEIVDIIAAGNDREQPTLYELASEMTIGGEKLRYLAADDVTRFAVNTMGAACSYRGRPILEPVLRPIALVNMFDTDRVTMNAIRTRIPLIRKVPGLRKPGVRNAMSTRGLPRAGTIAIVGKDEEWVWPSGPQDGASAERDRRALILRIATGVSLPEFLVSMDASNSNLASLLAASGPLVPMFTELRNTFSALFSDLLEEITGEVPTISFPMLVHESIEVLVKAYSQMYRDRIVSRRTYQAALGLDPEEEDKRLDQEVDDEEPVDYAPDDGDEEPGDSTPAEPEPLV